MIDPSIRQLLEEAIDSAIKLQLVLLFHENQRLELDAQQAANRTYRDIWATREALHELQHDGILFVSGSAENPCYHYRAQGDHHDRLDLLVRAFNEPIERDHIHHALRELASDASYRRARRQMRGTFELQMI
ncbi:MAG: hypothetical protein Fur005_25640 [Roseiflexaceae bacterium]